MTLVIAHRGSRGNRPENTLAAFKEAVRVGAEGIELDIRQTKDKEIVVIHDPKINRTTTGRGEVEKMTLKEIRQYDAGIKFSKEFEGEKIPSLREVLDLLEEMDFKGLLNIEIKTNRFFHKGVEKRLAEVVKERPRPFEIVYSGFDLRSLFKINRYDLVHEKYWLVKDVKENRRKILNIEKNNMISGVHSSLGFSIRDSNFIKNIKKKIRVWTVNRDKDLLYCFEQNLEGVITDYPQKALELREKFLASKIQKTQF